MDFERHVIGDWALIEPSICGWLQRRGLCVGFDLMTGAVGTDSRPQGVDDDDDDTILREAGHSLLPALDAALPACLYRYVEQMITANHRHFIIDC